MVDIIGEIKRTFKDGSVLSQLVYINLGVFLLVKILGVVFYLAGEPYLMVEWLSVPSNTNELISRPWTPITYMFMHVGFIHLLFNVLGLYWFGKLFLQYLDGDKLLSVYLLGGLAGAFLYLLAYNFIPGLESSNAVLLGASGSIYAILVAVAFYDPDREIMLPLVGSYKIKYIVAFYVLLSVIGISSTNAGGNIAHLGGAAWGWFYIMQLRKGKDIGAGFVAFIKSLGKFFKRENHLTVTHKQTPRDDYEYNRDKKVQQDEINAILDKIAKSGYDSLSSKEKELLFKQGKK